MDRELKRGTLEMVLLRLLSEREMYGYEIANAVRERGSDFAIRDGTLYPVLYRLEEAGYVEPRWQTQERGVPRKYYAVTAAGTRHMQELIGEWRTFVTAVEGLIGQEK